MEIRTLVPPSAAPSASSVQPIRMPGQVSPSVPASRVSAENVRTVPEVPTPAPIRGPQVARIRAEMHFDESINRVVGRVYDEATGREINEIPSEELRNLYLKTRQMLGPLVDETA